MTVDFLKSRIQADKVATLEREAERLVREYREESEEHFKRFAPRVNPCKLEAAASPDPHAFGRVHELVCGSEDNGGVEGVYLFGKTGTGKTCAALAEIWKNVYIPKPEHVLLPLLEAELKFIHIEERNERLPRFNEAAFQLWAASDLRDKFNEVCRSPDEKTELFEELNEAEFLFIDDFGHTLSASFAENMRLVLERTGACIFITSQYSPDKLNERWSRAGGREDLAEQIAAIDRRLFERCAVQEFRREPGNA